MRKHDNAKTAGYISAEVLQFVFGSEVFKAGAQGVKAAGRAFKESKHLANCIKKMPKNWISQSAKKGGGIKYVNPKKSNDYIRFMNKNTDSRSPLGQREPYFIRIKDGNKYLTKEGKWVLEGTCGQAERHIPQSMFNELLNHMDF
jgi:hypothetical protein